jgi:hypothetical protein
MGTIRSLSFSKDLLFKATEATPAAPVTVSVKS